jgi:hypothetical protein
MITLAWMTTTTTTTTTVSYKIHHHNMPIQNYLCSNHYIQSLTPLSLPLLSTVSLTRMMAKRNTKNNRRGDDDDLNRWYDDVDENATPDKVFWEEMERQRLLNQVGGESSNRSTNGANGDAISNNLITPRSVMGMTGSSSLTSLGGSGNTGNGYITNPSPPMPMSGFGGGFGNGGGGGGGGGASSFTGAAGGGSISGSFPIPPPQRKSAPTMEQIKMAESTLNEYELFQVADNWLNEDLQREMQEMNPIKLTLDNDDEQNDQNARKEIESYSSKVIDKDDDEYGMTFTSHDDDNDEENNYNGEVNDPSDLFFQLPEDSRLTTDDEPWDNFGEDSSIKDRDRRNVLEVPFPQKGKFNIPNIAVFVY